jgi:hypothetical protein
MSVVSIQAAMAFRQRESGMKRSYHSKVISSSGIIIRGTSGRQAITIAGGRRQRLTSAQIHATGAGNKAAAETLAHREDGLAALLPEPGSLGRYGAHGVIM